MNINGTETGNSMLTMNHPISSLRAHSLKVQTLPENALQDFKPPQHLGFQGQFLREKRRDVHGRGKLDAQGAGIEYNDKSVGTTWLRRGLQSRTGHTEAWLPRKYTQKSITANDNSYALAA
jgi:hypothetical protein